jgi:hypothetical protein
MLLQNPAAVVKRSSGRPTECSNIRIKICLLSTATLHGLIRATDNTNQQCYGKI